MGKRHTKATAKLIVRLLWCLIVGHRVPFAKWCQRYYFYPMSRNLQHGTNRIDKCERCNTEFSYYQAADAAGGE